MSEYPKGIYLLRVSVDSEKEIEVGSLSQNRVEGEYLYVGSALGPGGFKRVSRHLKVSSGEEDGGHWHIDHLTAAGEIIETWLIPTKKDLECKLAAELTDSFDQPIESFGASDCDCYSHLFSFEASDKSELIRKLNDLTPGAEPIRFDWK